ncbi:hypothetical protein E1A91_D09G057500v1 [Gossypium mustelinum]|uniref:HR-like lesion-inducer n=2 Tax=Gossypium TaxID=3633 RepID=A0A5D2TH15_GOSMU|nr:hypothetical protein ES288_D09G063800v1 [Gossypium darwinii]TYI64025.1 hypothetical protein E1A91_D09G057500v1 [Gossypium mustelinum]
MSVFPNQSLFYPPSLPKIDLHPLPPNINRSCQQSHVHRFSHVSLPEGTVDTRLAIVALASCSAICSFITSKIRKGYMQPQYSGDQSPWLHQSRQRTLMPGRDEFVRQFVATAIILKGLGVILFVFGHGFGALLLFVYLLVSTPLLYDFYNYRPNEPQYSVLLGDFLQCVAQGGALIFFVGMKNSMPKRQLRMKAPKQKAT